MEGGREGGLGVKRSGMQPPPDMDPQVEQALLMLDVRAPVQAEEIVWFYQF